MAESDIHQLVRETECFLGGRYAYDLWARGLPVPDWAWVNVLAHAPHGLLAALAATEQSECDQAGDLGKWQEAMAFLARQFLATATRTGQPLDTIQRQVALRLELEQYRADEGGVRAPKQLVDAVVSALEPYRGATYP